MSILKSTVVHALAASLIAGQIGAAAAAPLPTNVATMKSMVSEAPIPVYWRGGWGWGLGAGAVAGLIIGGAIANSAYGGYGSYGYPYGNYGYYPQASYGYVYGVPSYGYARPYYPAYGYARPYGAYGYARPYGPTPGYRYGARRPYYGW